MVERKGRGGLLAVLQESLSRFLTRFPADKDQEGRAPAPIVPLIRGGDTPLQDIRDHRTPETVVQNDRDSRE